MKEVDIESEVKKSHIPYSFSMRNGTERIHELVLQMSMLPIHKEKQKKKRVRHDSK